MGHLNLAAVQKFLDFFESISAVQQPVNLIRA